MALLLSFLPKVGEYTSTAEQFFVLLNSLVERSCKGFEGGKPADFEGLLAQVIKQLEDEHPIIETRLNTQEDHVLVGLLRLLIVLLADVRCIW